MKKLSIDTIILIIGLVLFLLGLGIGLSNNQYSKKLKAYEEYYDAVEAVLDECDRVHNISDTVCEGDIYEEYYIKKAIITNFEF